MDIFAGIWARINDEPVMVLGVVQAALGLFVSFGLHWTPEQIGATLALTAAVLSLLTRKRVTPV